MYRVRVRVTIRCILAQDELQLILSKRASQCVSVCAPMATYAPEILEPIGSLAEILSLVALDPAIWRAVATELGEPDAEDFALIAMKSSGDMDVVSYNTAEAVPWHRHSAVVVEALLHKMQRAGFQPNIAIYN